MAVVTAFSDESGGPNARDMFLLGGYVASVEAWGHFSSVWAEQVLNAKPTIPYVHMVELGREAFKNSMGLAIGTQCTRYGTQCVLSHAPAGSPL